MQHYIFFKTRRRAALVYTLRGVFYGSILWPIFVGITLLIASAYTERRAYRPPHIKYRSRYFSGGH